MHNLSFPPLGPSDFQPGEEVVVMLHPGVPVQCNTAHSREHPCRVRIHKVGRTRIHAYMSGDGKTPTSLTTPEGYERGDRGLVVVPIDHAKILYRDALSKYDRKPGFIDNAVERL